MQECLYCLCSNGPTAPGNNLCAVSVWIWALTCSGPQWARHQEGSGTWPVGWIQGVQWHNMEHRGRASWWNETDGVHGSRGDPSETHTHIHAEEMLHLHCKFYNRNLWKQFSLTFLSHDGDEWTTQTFCHGPFGRDWGEDISRFSRLIYDRDFRNVGATQPLWLRMENKSISWMSRWHFWPLLGTRDRKTYCCSFA